MKRYIAAAGLIILCMTAAAGCSLPMSGDASVQKWQEGVPENLKRTAEEISGGVASEEAVTEAEDTVGAETAGTAPEGEEAAALPAFTEISAYDYTQLTKQEQTLYTEILSGLERYEEDVPVSVSDETSFRKVFQCVMNDHPEIFYADGYTFIQHLQGDELQGSSFSGAYIYSREEIAQRKAAIERKAAEILAGAPTGDEYEKVKYVYEYLVMNTEYEQDSADNQNICSVFLNGSSVCQGYAKAAQYLFQRLGIDSVFVSGRVKGGEEHAWDMVQIDGSYYHVDVTWGDASYVMVGGSGDYDGRLPQVNYEYLCVPDDQIMKTHTIVSDVQLPACDSMDANYYVREGAYFTETDTIKEAGLFEKAYEDGSDYVTFKCADGEIYKEMKNRLIDRQGIFDYLRESGKTVAYTLNEEQLTLNFWL